MIMLKKILYWLPRIIASLILLQTLLFKFSGAPESVYIFSQLGLESHGRIGVGIMELITGILLLVPKYSGIGGLLGIGLMAGAIFSHLTSLGIEVQGDGGQLFIYALVVLFGCAITVFQELEKLKALILRK